MQSTEAVLSTQYMICLIDLKVNKMFQVTVQKGKDLNLNMRQKLTTEVKDKDTNSFL